MANTERNSLATLHTAAVRAIEDVMNTPPPDRQQIVDRSERAAVQLRDSLIERFRQAQDPQHKDLLRTYLVQVNVVVSLITGIEYPGAGMQEKAIQQALEVVRALDFSTAGENGA